MRDRTIRCIERLDQLPTVTEKNRLLGMVISGAFTDVMLSRVTCGGIQMVLVARPMVVVQFGA